MIAEAQSHPLSEYEKVGRSGIDHSASRAQTVVVAKPKSESSREEPSICRVECGEPVLDPRSSGTGGPKG